LDEGCLKVAKGDLIASVFLAFVFSGFFGLVYNINPESGWPILTTIGLLFFSISAYLLQNQRKNQRKWEKRPITFPNPEGGGILGLYTGRPWYSELAGLGRRYKRKRHKFQDKVGDRSKIQPHCRLVEKFVLEEVLLLSR
jgi:hypothetical protein